MRFDLATGLDATAYEIDTNDVITPALAIYPNLVRHNIQCTLKLLGGDAHRWRPHIKTVKAESIIRLLTEAGVTAVKCATTLELLTSCQAGATDVVVAYSQSGANAARLLEIAGLYPHVAVSTLVEGPAQVDVWAGTPIGLFIDVNPGMDRTGISLDRVDAIVELTSKIISSGARFRGLHFYDGHATEEDLEQRTVAAHQRYDRLLELVGHLEQEGIAVEEVITSGTPAFPCALSYGGFADRSFIHRVSPGTIVYNDTTSLRYLPAEYGYRPAVAIISRVVSHPRPDVLTCDAGHKSVSVDSGVPNCFVIGHPGWEPLKPSEEHLPIRASGNGDMPQIGTPLYLIPRHVCPSVNNFDRALLIEDGTPIHVAPVTARGHEGPYL